MDNFYETYSYFLFFNVFNWLYYYNCSNFSLLPLSAPCPLPSSNAPLSSCPWVMHINSWASPFLMLLLISSCLFCPYQLCFFFNKYFTYLFLDRGEGKEQERLPLMCPYCGPRLQPMHVPWLRIEPVILWFTGQCSIHWATPARAQLCFVIPAPCSWIPLPPPSWKPSKWSSYLWFCSYSGCLLNCELVAILMFIA